jgi:hypothetical protein
MLEKSVCGICIVDRTNVILQNTQNQIVNAPNLPPMIFLKLQIPLLKRDLE